MTHPEIDWLREAGRFGSFRDTVLYSSLMPCYLCSRAVAQFGIRKVIVGESRNFPGASDFMRSERAIFLLRGGRVVNPSFGGVSAEPSQRDARRRSLLRGLRCAQMAASETHPRATG